LNGMCVMRPCLSCVCRCDISSWVALQSIFRIVHSPYFFSLYCIIHLAFLSFSVSVPGLACGEENIR
jgi:hypothetical protein